MKLATIFYLIQLFLVSAFAEEEPEFYWPREIEHEKGTITLYQPQLESFEANRLEGRMAVSVNPDDQELFFGALWFSAQIVTDTEERVVVLESIDITQTRFPDLDQDKIQQFTSWLEEQVEGRDIEMSLDRLLASLELIETQKELSAQLNNEPPDIYFRTSPAILVYIDGEPILETTEDSDVKYVVNSPYFIVQDTKKGNYYIKGGKWWLTSSSITTGWEVTKKVPKSIAKIAEQALDPEAEEDSAMMAMEEPPEIIVTIGPAELVQTDGDPDYVPIQGTSLLYVKNTESDILTDINSQEHYLLLAGRWFHSRTLADGDWKFSEPEDLPDDFEKIPAESDMASVRSSVPGTEEATSAVLAQTIPQTATVDRETATVEVVYDGDPEFTKIENTQMSYAANADKDVLLINDSYYCVDDGIWFQSKKATGPWEVSVERPMEVDEIPPEAPVYHVKYVYIYDSTPEVVYVGYLPGYTCSYVYGGVVVYGTGYYYYPWYRTVYYPRPATWGFGVHYNPWTGWGFSYGYSTGWFTIRVGRRGWWGPAGYRRGYRHGYRRGYHRGYRAGARAGYRAGQRQSGRNNVYRNRSNGVSSTGVASNRAQGQARSNQGGAQNRAGNQAGPQTGGQGRDNRAAQTRPSQQPNNVYSDNSGNVYRRENNGNVQQRSQGQWNNSASQNRNNDVNRSHQSRQQGSRNYNSSPSRSSAGRGGGGRRR